MEASRFPEADFSGQGLPIEETDGKLAEVFEIEEFRKLIETARESGLVNATDISALVDEYQVDADSAGQLTGLFETLHIEVVDEQSDVDDSSWSDTETASTTDGLQLFLQEIGKPELLTAAQEVELSKTIEKGRLARGILESKTEDVEGYEQLAQDYNRLFEASELDLEAIAAEGTEAKRIMMERNLRLVVSIAKPLRNKGLPFLDLIQEGTIGLARAADKFDWRKGFKFSTYATWWIRQAMQRGLANQGRTIRVPVHVHDRILKINRVTRQLTQKLGRQPTLEEVAHEAKININDAQEAQNAANKTPVALDKYLNDEEENTLRDFVADQTEPNPEEAAIENLRHQAVHRMLEDLPERERFVLVKRYGLDGGEPESLEVVGKQLGITRERVRQIEAHALKRLTAVYEAKAVRDS